MRRIELTEIHDHPAFPGFLRDQVTMALEAIWNRTGVFRPILPILDDLLASSGENRIVDLCSGAGGPWLTLAEELKRRGKVHVTLTDRYPNEAIMERVRAASPAALSYHVQPVDARQVPGELHGLRTLFSSFHHFGPRDARSILEDAARAGQKVAIFETAQRRALTFATVCVLPLLVLLLAPRVRPFRWSTLVFTYLVPVVPFVILYDGIVSCLRTYSAEELDAMTASICVPGYAWKRGQAGTGKVRITWLAGAPIAAFPASDQENQLEVLAR